MAVENVAYVNVQVSSRKSRQTREAVGDTSEEQYGGEARTSDGPPRPLPPGSQVTETAQPSAAHT